MKSIEKFIFCGYMILLLIAYNIMSIKDSVVSSLFSLLLIYILVYFVYCNKKHSIPNSYNIIIFSSIFFVILNVTLSGFGGFEYYKKAFLYIATLMWLVCCSFTKVNMRTVIIIFSISFIINCLYINFYNTGYSLYEGEVLLTLNFTNPNLAGLFILSSVLYICILIASGHTFFTKKRYYFLLLLILVPVAFLVIIFLYYTGCRSALLSICLFVLLTLFEHLNKGGLPINRNIIFLFVLFPLVFVFFYLSEIGNLDFDTSMGHESGKSATSRIAIWKPIIDNIDHYFLIGDYYGISNGTGSSQMHNTHLDIYASYGILPLILYITIITKILWHLWSNALTRFQRISLYAFISSLVTCTFEASFITGSAGLFVLQGGILLLANYNNQKNA